MFRINPILRFILFAAAAMPALAQNVPLSELSKPSPADLIVYTAPADVDLCVFVVAGRLRFGRRSRF